MEKTKNPSVKHPPSLSKNFISDIRNFLLHKPEEKTLLTFGSMEDHENYCNRIMQRTGIKVDSYSVLNIHKIGIDVPAHYVFDELLQWNGSSTCWPNHIAQVELKNKALSEIEILLFGKKRLPFGIFSPLFRLHAIRIQHIPPASDCDNARYLLYKCSGGYPIGVFTMYVRSSIPEENESGQTQLLMAVGFDFYGHKKKPGIKLVNSIWEYIHNRVTTNTLSRFKQLCEWRFDKIQHSGKKTLTDLTFK